MEQSVFIIKPEALEYREKIHGMIRGAGLTIVQCVDVVLTEDDVRILYPTSKPADVPNEEKDETIRHLTTGISEIGIVEGKGAVNRLLRICGDKTVPMWCARGTIRRELGPCMPERTLPSGKPYPYNIIHRPRNWEEARRDRRIAKHYL